MQATVLMALDLDTLTQRADLVMRAEVLSLEAKTRGSPGRILTDVELRMMECWKGSCPDVLTAFVAGGREGVVEQRMSGSAQFMPGEECVVFLKAQGRNRFRVLGMAQGKYRLEWKADLSEPVAIPEKIDAELIYSDAQRMVMPLRREMPLSQLRQKVRGKLLPVDAKLGVGGKP
ncbi:MAG: hypothetical protein FWG75_03165 [Cystobacterineae bacterium]|nr:hypothetical protein [Cystobacterineae bacterium]